MAMEWVSTINLTVTGLVGLSGGLGGAWLADSRARNREHITRNEQRRDELRTIVTDCLVDARDLIGLEWLLVPILAKMESRDLTEFAATESGQAMQARNERLTRSLTAARLLVREESDLGSALAQVQLRHRGLAEEAHGPVMNPTDPDERWSGTREGFAYVRQMQLAVDEVERLAIGELARLGEPHKG